MVVFIFSSFRVLDLRSESIAEHEAEHCASDGAEDDFKDDASWFFHFLRCGFFRGKRPSDSPSGSNGV